MKRSKRAAGWAAALLAFSTLLLFAGCGKEEPKPSAGGYYDGPMKPKGGGTGNESQPGTGQGTAPGNP